MKICKFFFTTIILGLSTLLPLYAFAENCSQSDNSYLADECKTLDYLLQQKQQALENNLNLEMQQQNQTNSTPPQQPKSTVYQRQPQQIQAAVEQQLVKPVIQAQTPEKKHSIYY